MITLVLSRRMMIVGYAAVSFIYAVLDTCHVLLVRLFAKTRACLKGEDLIEHLLN